MMVVPLAQLPARHSRSLPHTVAVAAIVILMTKPAVVARIAPHETVRHHQAAQHAPLVVPSNEVMWALPVEVAAAAAAAAATAATAGAVAVEGADFA